MDMNINMHVYGINPCVASVCVCGGGVIYPETQFSHHCRKSAWNFLERYQYRQQERPAVADKPMWRLQNVCTVYVRAVGL